MPPAPLSNAAVAALDEFIIEAEGCTGLDIRGDTSPVQGVKNLKVRQQGTSVDATVTIPDVQFVDLLFERQWGGDGFWSGQCDCDFPGKICPHLHRAAAYLRSMAAPPAVRPAAASEEDAQVAAFRALVAARMPSKWPDMSTLAAFILGWRNSRGPAHHWTVVPHMMQAGVYGSYTDRPEPTPSDLSLLDFACLWAGLLKARLQKVPWYLAILKREDASPRVQGMLKEHELEIWRDRFKSFGAVAAGAPAVSASVKELDVRIVLGDPHEATVEVRTLPGKSWRPLTRAALEKVARGQTPVIAAAQTLWQAVVAGAWQRGHNADSISCDNPAEWTGLRQCLHLPEVAARILTATGAPVLLSSTPVAWRMDEPQDGAEEYRLYLCCDGTPLDGGIGMVIQGNPPLYLLGSTLYPGPVVSGGMAASMHIPATAVESPDGLTALRRLKVPLPARLEKSIREVRLTARIRAEIHKASGADWLAVWVEAGPEGDVALRRLWHNGHWKELPANPAARDKSRAVPGAPVEVYDESALEAVPALVGTLPLKWNYSAGCFDAKVWKKMPEQLAAFFQALPAGTEVDLDDELQGLADAPQQASFHLEVAEAGIDWFDVKVVLSAQDTNLTKAEEAALLAAKGGWVKLAGKGWRKLELTVSPEQDEDLARLGLSTQQLNGESQKFHALQLADSAARRFMAAEQAEAIRRRAADLQASVAPPVPASVTATLRRYQEDGFHFLCYLSTNSFGGVLADDMGLGKTLQTLTWLEWLRKKEIARGVRPAASLVVCPKSVMDNWQAEAARFLPHFNVRIWRAGEVARLPEQLASADLHVINYAGLRSLTAPHLSFMAVILDEAQAIKNPSSESARAACGLTAAHRLALTGTPIENRLLDLWSIVNFAMPGALGNRASFGRTYDVKDDPLARRRLSARVRPFLLRRTKGQVAQDLPDRLEEDLFCAMEGMQLDLYRAELKTAQQTLLKLKSPSELNKARFNILTSMLRLRQICCDPRLLNPKAKSGDSAKLEALHDTVGPLLEEGHKVLIFSQFVTMLDLLKNSFGESGAPVFYLSGDTEDRGALVQRFQAAEGAAVFLISLKAGGFGLNLTAASHVILFDPWWNPAVEAQAIDRTHRIGQKQKVIAWRLLIKDSIEEKIRQLQKQKAGLAGDILGEERFSASLTLSDLQYLFAD